MQEGEIRMRKIMIIGAGGIGSFLAANLDRIGIYKVTVFDEDTVEDKNLTYQNYSASSIGEQKVHALQMDLSDRVRGEPYWVLTSEQLQGYDLVVCCADNLAVRRLLYREGYGPDAPTKWLDLRAQGRNAALISYMIEPELAVDLLTGPEGSFSCQGEDWDGSAEGIDTMHMAIAGVGAQWIQKWFINHDDVAHNVMLNI
jgi:hypothetical protein